ALDRARSELEQLNLELDHRVRERTCQLEQAYRDLESFSYTVAHDVRAPIASIAGFAEALEPALAESTNERHRHYLRRIRANASQMDQLTRQLLELGKLTRAPLAFVDLDLSGMAQDIAQQLQESEPDRNVDVLIEPQLKCRGDR